MKIFYKGVLERAQDGLILDLFIKVGLDALWVQFLLRCGFHYD